MISLSRDCIIDIAGTGHIVTSLSNLSLRGVQCTGNTFVDLFHPRYTILSLPQFLLGFLNNSTCCGSLPESHGEAGDDTDLAVPSFPVCSVLWAPAETFGCFPRQHKPCWQPPGKVSPGETGNRQGEPSFLPRIQLRHWLVYLPQ